MKKNKSLLKFRDEYRPLSRRRDQDRRAQRLQKTAAFKTIEREWMRHV